MADRLELLLAAAERLTVDLVAQTPVAVRLENDTPGYARHVADSEGFDVLPVQESDGRILRYIDKVALDAHRPDDTWDGFEFVEVHADDLVSAATPLLDLLNRFSRARPRLFVLGRRQIDGIVTVYDLNQPAAHQFGFALSLVVEAELARSIEVAERQCDKELDVEVDQRIAQCILALPRDRFGGAVERVTRWRAKVETGAQVRLSRELVFNDKIGVVEATGLADELARRCAALKLGDGAAFVERLRREVKALRNAVAHDRDDLADEWSMWQWMRTTLDLARALSTQDDRK